MSSSPNTTLKMPALEVPREAPASAVEQARCLDNASRLVEDFTRKSAPQALDALLAAASADSPGQAAKFARQAAETAADQAETLLDEVARFLTLTRPRPGDAG